MLSDRDNERNEIADSKVSKFRHNHLAGRREGEGNEAAGRY